MSIENINNLYNQNKKGGQKNNKSIIKFVKSVGNNRVLDLYLKILGISILNTNTLIPLAFILGAQTFNKVVNNISKNEKSGGGLKYFNNKLPILDDAAVGTYLKITGLTMVPLSPYTLVPLGVLMYLYDKMNMKGGNISKSKLNNINYNINTKSLEFGQSGGSDFKMVNYSRGPVNTNLVTPEIHSKFNQTAPFISNNDLQVGAYYDGHVPKTLTNDSVYTNPTTSNPLPLSPDGFGKGMYGGKKRRTMKKKSKNIRRRKRKSSKKNRRKSRKSKRQN